MFDRYENPYNPVENPETDFKPRYLGGVQVEAVVRVCEKRKALQFLSGGIVPQLGMDNPLRLWIPIQDGDPIETAARIYELNSNRRLSFTDRSDTTPRVYFKNQAERDLFFERNMSHAMAEGMSEYTIILRGELHSR